MIKIEKLNPFGRMCISLGMLPSSYKESLTYEEQLLWFFKYLEETVIPTVNNNAEAVEELQTLYTEIKTYVDSYFDNLDVQEEINNKLDDMAESGQLTDIIAQYLQLAGVLAFNTLADLENSENVVNGSICLTLGKDAYNDGKSAYYKIRNILNTDVVDDDNLIAIAYNNSLVGEKIKNYYLDEIYKNCFYEEITYTTNRVDETDYYLTTIPKYTNDGNLINLYVDKFTGTDDNSPNKYAQKNLTSFTCNAGLDIKDSDNQYHQTLVISNGEIINPVYNFTNPLDNFYQYLCFDDERNVTSYQANSTTPEYLLNQGVKQAFLVWWKLINNGEIETYDNPAYSTTDDVRQVLGVKNNGDIVLLTNDGRSSVSKGFTATQVANILLANDVVNAWELDGGGSTSTNVKTIKINRNVDSVMTKDRTIKYTLNAKKDTNYKNVGKAYAEISKQKQELNKQIMDYVNAINNVKCFTFNDTTLTKDGLTNILSTRKNYYGNSNVDIANNVMTTSKAGIFEINGYLEFTGTGGTKYLEIYVNSQQRFVERFTGSANVDLSISFTCGLNLNANDIIEFAIDGVTGDKVRRGQYTIKYYGN